MSSGSGYDNSVTTFSPDGRVFQVEYAQKAVEKASSVIGIHCKDGILIVAEKLQISKQQKEKANPRIHQQSKHAAIAVSGIQPDGRALANFARNECRDYNDFYGTHIPGSELANRIASRIHRTTIYWQERPFGCTAVIMTYDEYDGYGLYTVGPTGELIKHRACCVGRHSQTAKTELERISFDDNTTNDNSNGRKNVGGDLTVREAVLLAVQIFYKLHDDVKEKEFVLEMNWLCEESSGCIQRVPDDIVQDAIEIAKAEKLHALMEDSDEE